MNDNEMIAAILDVAKRHGLTIDYHGGAGSFRDVYLSASRAVLNSAAEELRFNGVRFKWSTVTNPDHPEAGRPMIEIESVWWNEEFSANYKPRPLAPSVVSALESLLSEVTEGEIARALSINPESVQAVKNARAALACLPPRPTIADANPPASSPA